MPLVTRGFYIDSREERPYEVETTYQLRYYVSSALISIDYILLPVEEMMARFENKVEYYRYNIDALFNFLGLINDRFFCKSSSRESDLQEKKKEPNRRIGIILSSYHSCQGKRFTSRDVGSHNANNKKKFAFSTQ